ncbi:hypothetical protein C493_13198 [Natronolimnohabitans innermongolicus JCM 12255]|uniref:Uncharacterized protein n=1 Tax=Natronolimnohabitans innermongolicus JCM 12255 TaxID=1227499 RepID=L9X088_9EURY|nr:hypothetical protein C493_13198 [Natronolimnohabitans innermongolicus JCM 12255]
MLIFGALVLVASSGAFDATSADRGVGIETASDEDALLGLEYDETHQLVSTNGEGSCTGFIIGSCAFEYEEDLIHLEDNTVERDLDIWLEDGTTSDTEIVDDISINDETATVEGSFQCPAGGYFLVPTPGDQAEASETATIAIAASNDDVTIELERDVTIQCQPD